MTREGEAALSEAARFLALEAEAERLLEEALAEGDPERELALLREARRLRAQLAEGERS